MNASTATKAGKLVHETAIGSMFSGHKITIQGYTTQCKKECNCSFDINLECKTPCGKSSIPLCISVRFGEKCIARNTFNQCSWGQEEKNGGMPIIRGQPFVIELECKPQAFSISINSCYFSDYQHRLPFSTINNLTVTGDVDIHYVNLSKTLQEVCHPKPMSENTVNETTIGKMFDGQKIKIECSTTECSNGFNINLECKPPCGTSSIHLRMSVRFGEGCIIRNTFDQCSWGQEERDGGMPIIRGQVFFIELECKAESFSISINGCYFCDYKHRLPFNTINRLTVTGDVVIHDVNLSGTPPKSCDDQTLYPNLLYASVIPGMFPDRRIKIEGDTTKCCVRFVVILKSKSANGSSFTNPLFISVLCEMGCIVRNTFNYCLGQEEKCGGMPITRGEKFIIEVVCKPDVFTIIINGCHFCDYKHRLPYKTVNILTVRGDDFVKIRDVNFSGIPPNQTWNDTIPADVEFQPIC